MARESGMWMYGATTTILAVIPRQTVYSKGRRSTQASFEVLHLETIAGGRKALKAVMSKKNK